jgi:hypothetical protein
VASVQMKRRGWIWKCTTVLTESTEREASRMAAKGLTCWALEGGAGYQECWGRKGFREKV